MKQIDWEAFLALKLTPDEAVAQKCYREYGRAHVIHILMTRDKLSLAKAREKVIAVSKALIKASDKGDFEKCYDIVMKRLGLEPDYIEGLIP